MPRPKRIIAPGFTYHVFCRCIEKRALLQTTFASNLLVKVLAQTQEKYNYDLIAYQIMDNHFHFVIQTRENEASISTIMQYIKARFAEKYNRAKGRSGPFWNERFGDTIVEKSDRPVIYLLYLLWYLAFNPVRKSLASNPRLYPYGSIKSYLEENYESPVRISLHEYFLDLGKTFAERVKAFLYYEEAYRKRLALLF
ncbi:MAG TPA: transposase [Spirochaetota bacterium]|jgi:REP element-mobilizing transposase RayT|nr:transposase [Treponemataceae bacterium]HPI15956.1 transposase [Spirochaetota bacterium]HPO45574.1 transposase [Spirochaetota bacterium]